MKKILITGADSYIGTSFKNWCEQHSDKYTIDVIDIRGDSWRKVSFAGYDVVLHLAGIVHTPIKQNTKNLYYKVNRDLAIEAAEKAKMDGVNNFIFMSSMSVYGNCCSSVIDKNTVPKPSDYYGKSKLQAEEGLKRLQNNMFSVVIIRPPMVYGKGCKGNYQKLSKLAKITPVFPDIENKRSMIHIDNLCEFIKLMIENDESGTFFPQNEEYVRTSELVRLIGSSHDRSIKLIRIFDPVCKILIKKTKIFNKLFGDLTYKHDLSKYKTRYQIRCLTDSIILTERRNTEKKKALITASVASMIDLFCMNDIHTLEESGYEIHIACNFERGNVISQSRIEEFTKNLKEKGYFVYQIPIPRSIFSIKNIIMSYRMMKLLCRNNNFRLVHCHTPIGGFVTRLAFRKERKYGTKLVYTAHGFHFYKGAPLVNWLLYYPIEFLLSRYTDVLITINKEDYLKASHFRMKKLEYVPGIGIDINKFEKVIDVEKKKKSLGIQNNDFILLSVGELSKRKNHEVVLKAIAKINDISIKYLICGKGGLHSYLKELVHSLGIESQVKFLGYRSDIAELCLISDIFLFPSKQEGLPVALMEAMACGRPCIVSKIRGNTELIQDSKGGYLFKSNDVNDIVEKIKKMHSDETLRKSMGAFNQVYIKKFDLDTVSQCIRRIYSEI